MSFRTKLLALVDVLLRVPPLFIMDELLRIGLGVPQGDSNHYNSSSEVDDADTSILGETVIPTVAVYSDSEGQYQTQFYKVLIVTSLKYLLSCLGKFSPLA
jgi:hypothetical protein